MAQPVRIGPSIAQLRHTAGEWADLAEKQKQKITALQENLDSARDYKVTLEDQDVTEQTNQRLLQLAIADHEKLLKKVETEMQKNRQLMEKAREKNDEAQFDMYKNLVEQRQEAKTRLQNDIQSNKLILADVDEKRQKLQADILQVSGNIALIESELSLAEKTLEAQQKQKAAIEKQISKQQAEAMKPKAAGTSEKRKADVPRPVRSAPNLNKSQYGTGTGTYQALFNDTLAVGGSEVTIRRIVVAIVNIYDRYGAWMWLPDVLRSFPGNEQLRIYVAEQLLALLRSIAEDEKLTPFVRTQAAHYYSAIQAYANLFESDPDGMFKANDPTSPGGQQTRDWVYRHSIPEEPSGAVLMPKDDKGVEWAPRNASYSALATELADRVLRSEL